MSNCRKCKREIAEGEAIVCGQCMTAYAARVRRYHGEIAGFIGASYDLEKAVRELMQEVYPEDVFVGCGFCEIETGDGHQEPCDCDRGVKLVRRVYNALRPFDLAKKGEPPTSDTP